MGFLRRLFGPSRKEIWQQFCQEVGGQYVKGGFLKGDKVLIHHGQWTITLDTFTESSGDSSSTYTRLRAPYINKDGFRFTIYRKSIFSGLGKLLGMQDVEIGDPEFDEAFIIKGNDEAKLRALFANERIRRLIQMQPRIYLTAKDELYFRVLGVIKDFDRLKSLYYLFAEMLHYLCQIGSAREDDPQLKL